MVAERVEYQLSLANVSECEVSVRLHERMTLEITELKNSAQ